MERTARGPGSKASASAVLEAAVVTLLAGAAFWLDMRHEYRPELQAHQSLLAAMPFGCDR